MAGLQHNWVKLQEIPCTPILVAADFLEFVNAKLASLKCNFSSIA